MRSDSNCRNRVLFFAVRSNGTAGRLLAKRLSSPISFDVAPVWYWATWIRVLATPITNALGSPIGLAVVIAKNGLEPLRADQIGKRRNGFAVLRQDGSTPGADVRAADAAWWRQEGAWAPPAARRIDRGWREARDRRPRPAGSSGLGRDHFRCLGGRLEGEDGQLGGRPGIEFRAGLVPEFGNAAHQVAWLRVERLGLKPSQESLNDCVVHLRPARCPDRRTSSRRRRARSTGAGHRRRLGAAAPIPGGVWRYPGPTGQ